LSILVAVDSARLLGQGFPGFFVWDNGYLASFHDAHWTGPSSGLPLNGGRVLRLDDAPFTDGMALIEHAQAQPVGSPVRYEIQTPETEVQFVVPTMIMTRWDYATTIGIYLVNALAFFAIGVAALFLRPEHIQVRMFAGAIITLGLVLILAIDLNTTYRFVEFYFVAEAMLPACVIGFGLVFPTDLLGRRRRRMVSGSIFALALATGIMNASLFYQAPATARTLTNISWVWIGLAGACLLLVLGYSLFRASSERERVQGAVVFSGAMVAFIFGAMGLLAFFVVGWTFSLAWWVGPLFFFPLTVLYAIFRLDLFKAERYIRTPLGYTVATAAVVLAYAAGVLLQEQTVSSSASISPAASFVFLISLVVVFEPIRRSVQRGIDRMFYRSVLDPAHELKESSLEIAALTDSTQVREQLAARIRDALDLEWAETIPDPPAPGRAALQEPISYRDELLGWLAVGPKRSGAPFSHSERELVRGMASQSALALRNLQSLEDLRDTQDSLVRIERLAVIGEFSRAVAHGIRNPLASIRAAVQIAETRSDESRIASPLQEAMEQADRLDRRVRELLEYSRPFESRNHEARLAGIIDDVQRSLSGQAKQQGVRLESAVRPDPNVRLCTDVALLTEALLELGANALRVMSSGGTLEMSAETGTGQVVIEVRDQGPGIPDNVRQRIFEPFYTTTLDRSGLGLPTVRKIATTLGGELELADSGPGETTFRFVFPISNRSPAPRG